MVPSATATGVRVTISAISTRMKTRNPRNDSMAPLPVLYWLAAVSLRGRCRRLRPDADKRTQPVSRNCSVPTGPIQ